MINVIVSYTVKREYVQENKANIANFLKDFQSLNNQQFIYSVFLKDDGLTFVHISHYSDAVIQKQILNMPSFLAFQKERDESGVNDTHAVQVLEYVGSSQEIF